jgi:hypothetical protein
LAGTLPERFHGTRPTTRGQSGYPAVPRQPAPRYQPGSLDFDHSTATPEELWAQLSEAVKARVNARTGKVVQWWASSTDSRVSAVVFGTDALVMVEPTVNSAGGRVNRVSSIALDPTSFRHVRVQAPGSPGAPAGTRPAPEPASPKSERLERILQPDLAGLLGHLPARAQELLQDPFLGHQDDIRYGYYYLRTDDGSGGRGIGGATLRVWCYLTDLRTVTFAAGVGHGFRDGAGANEWDVTCWRAAVAPRKR